MDRLWTTGPRCGFPIQLYTCAQVLNSETFNLPIAHLLAANGALANYRDTEPNDGGQKLAELGQSILDLGQLQPVLVARSPEGWILAAGFRRVAAILSVGGDTVSAKEVDADRIDLIRLAENFDRQDPTSFETCRYLFELNQGREGRPKRTHGEIAGAVGLSAKHVGNLIRFYREAPDAMRQAWKQDRDQRFSFTALNTLVRAAKRGENFEGALASVLGTKGPRALGATSEAKPATSTPAPKGRRLGRTGADRLALRLAQAGEERLKTDDRAVILLELLGAVAGHVPAKQVEARIDSILADLGFDVSKPAEAGGGLQYDIEKGWN